MKQKIQTVILDYCKSDGSPKKVTETQLNFLNPSFNTRKIRQFISNYIVDYDYNHFSDLSFSDKCEIAALLMETSDGDCLVETNDLNDLLLAIRRSLVGSHDDDENLVFTIKEQIVRYYSTTIEDLFNSCLEEYRSERNTWSNQIDNYNNEVKYV